MVGSRDTEGPPPAEEEEIGFKIKEQEAKEQLESERIFHRIVVASKNFVNYLEQYNSDSGFEQIYGKLVPEQEVIYLNHLFLYGVDILRQTLDPNDLLMRIDKIVEDAIAQVTQDRRMGWDLDFSNNPLFIELNTLKKTFFPAREKEEETKKEEKAKEEQEFPRSFVIRNTKNIYRDIYIEGGLDRNHRRCAEKKERAINLEEEVSKFRAQCFDAGMNSWAQAVPDLKSLGLNKNKVTLLQKLLRNRYLFIMPDRATLAATFKQAVERLLPYVKSGGHREYALSTNISTEVIYLIPQWLKDWSLVPPPERTLFLPTPTL